MEKTALLERAGITGDDVYPLTKALDRGTRSRARDIPAASDFLSPRQQVLAADLLRLAEFPADTFLFTGGYPSAERKVLVFLPSWLDCRDLEAVLGLDQGSGVPVSRNAGDASRDGRDTPQDGRNVRQSLGYTSQGGGNMSQSGGDALPDFLELYPDVIPVRFLRASYRREDGLTHRDLLGSLMGMGVARESVGDILVGEDGADLAVLEGVEQFLLQSWESAGRFKIQVSSVSPSRLHIPELRCQEIRDTVSSLRLDAVVSAGFRMARGKAADLIEAGRVEVDWRECVKPDRTLSQGCVVTARGFGKMELVEAGRLTKKGRIAIVIRRYL